MKIETKSKVMISLLSILVLLLSACNGALPQIGAGEPTPEPTTEPAPEPTTEPVPEPTTEPIAESTTETSDEEEITITISTGSVGLENDIIKAAAQRYMDEHPDITVEVLELPDSATERLALYQQFLAMGSSELDIYQIDVIWPGDLAEHLIDLAPYDRQEVISQHFPAIVENNTVDGKLVAIPWFVDAGLLYYRTDLLTKYGYNAPPKTWDELEEMASTIQEGELSDNGEFVGYVWQGRAYEGLTCDALEWIASHGGGTVVSPDGVITINNPLAIAALERAASWVGTISPEDVTDAQEEDARLIWHAGNAAFMRNWPYAYPLSISEDSNVVDKFGVAPLPAGEDGMPAAALGGWQLAVSAYSKHPDIAADVAYFLASPEEQKIRAIEGAYNPTIETLYQDEQILEASPFFGELYDVFINATPRPSTITAPNYNDVSTLFFEAVNSVLIGEQEAEAALKQLELDLEELLSFPTGNP